MTQSYRVNQRKKTTKKKETMLSDSGSDSQREREKKTYGRGE